MHIAVFGGTFNPFHDGHHHVIHLLQRVACFDRIDVLPCRVPVHKTTCHTDLATRLGRIQHELQRYNHTSPPVCLNRTELDRLTPSYAIDTLRELHQMEPQVIWTWVVGDDCLDGLSGWFEYDELPKWCHLLVIPRLYDPSELKERMALLPWDYAAVEKLTVTTHGLMAFMPSEKRHPASSTAIRQGLMD